ncbi:MAG: acyl-CoA desaturase [Candidatus Abawacabacteria bacterium]|nr:acyl-CoA desaturase [Candidatus Abawacabacteria bacterium]
MSSGENRIVWFKTWPFMLMHLMPLGVFFVPVRLIDVLMCIGLYYLRMFFITAGFHRYFAHRTYKMGRIMQFVMAFGGTMAAQKGVLWWASYHRHHHHYSDTESDIHSPIHGFWWSHIGWIMSEKYDRTRFDLIKDFTVFPELRFLNQFYLLPPFLLAGFCYWLGGMSMLFWGFFLSTALLYHGTFTINSFNHIWGKRRYVTNDSSRNSLLLALITCGEGWHNNHHYYPASVRQGFFWWEIDISFYVLTCFKYLGLVKDLVLPAKSMLLKKRIKDGNFDLGLFNVTWQRVMAFVPDNTFDKAKLYVIAKQEAWDSWLERGRLSGRELKQIVQQSILRMKNAI